MQNALIFRMLLSQRSQYLFPLLEQMGDLPRAPTQFELRHDMVAQHLHCTLVLGTHFSVLTVKHA